MQKLFWLHKHLVRSVIKKMLGRLDEDLEQEVYIRIWQKYETYQEQDKFGAWVRVITTNMCKDYLKSKSQKLLQSSVNDDDYLENLSKNDNPEKDWLLKCRRKLILQAVDNLPNNLKQVIKFVEFEGFSYDLTAKKLGIKVGTVKSRLNTAKKELSNTLAYLEI